MEPITTTALALKLLPWIVAGGAAHFGLKGYEALGQKNIGMRQIEAMIKSQKTQAEMGKREQERMEALMKQLLGFRKEEKRESRELETMRMLEASRGRQTAMLMGLMQAMSGMGQQAASISGGGGVPSSYLSLLR